MEPTRDARRGERSAGVLGLWTLWAAASPLGFDAWTVPMGERERRHVEQVRARLETAVRSHAPGTTVCLPVEPEAAAFGYPGTLGVFVLYHPGDELEGRRVRFASSDPRGLALRDTSARLRTLIVPDGVCPPPDEASG
jgi:hypothetical protein